MGISPQDAHSSSFFKAGMGKAAAFKAVAHGLSRAAIARLRYGNMKGAFLSGFVTSGFSVGAGAGYKGAFVMAIVGGTASEIGGGKFANGAWGSAFQYLFNDMMDPRLNGKVGRAMGGDGGISDAQAQQNSISAGVAVAAPVAAFLAPEGAFLYAWTEANLALAAMGDYIVTGTTTVYGYMLGNPVQITEGVKIANDMFNNSEPPSTGIGAMWNIYTNSDQLLHNIGIGK